MPFVPFPPRKRDGGLHCGIPPLRQKAGFLPPGTENGAGTKTGERCAIGMPFALFPPRKRDGGLHCGIPPLRQKAGFLPPGTKDGGNGAGFRPQDRKTRLSLGRSRPEIDAPRCKRRGREWRVRRRGLRCRIPPFRQKAGFLPDGTNGEERGWGQCRMQNAECRIGGRGLGAEIEGTMQNHRHERRLMN